VRIAAQADDSNGDTLTYYINDSRFTQQDNVFTWQTGPYDSGDYGFLVNVTDGVYWDEQPVHVTVEDTCQYFNKKQWCWDCECGIIIQQEEETPVIL
jgi:hypothetical protein